MTRSLPSNWPVPATIVLVGLWGCAPPCEETLVEDSSEFEDPEAAATAEAFCTEPTLALVLGEASHDGEWTEADWVEDGDEAWFRAGWAGGWTVALGFETTSLSQAVTTHVAATYEVVGRSEAVDGPEFELLREAQRAEPDSSAQRGWAMSLHLPCELSPIEPLSGSCEWIDVSYEDVTLILEVTVTDRGGRSASATHAGPIRVEESPP